MAGARRTSIAQKFGGKWISPSKSSRFRLARLDPQEEQAILQITQELISRLGVHNLNPKSVITWSARTIDPRISKDQVLLPVSLYDKLSSDEWRPLIAAKLIYHRNFTKTKMVLAFSYQVFPFVTLPLFLAISSILGLIPQPERIATGAILLWVIAMYPVAKVVYGPWFRKLQQTADKQTLELYVNPTLEDVLRKIEMMTPQGSKGNKSIEKRIRVFRESA